MNSGKAIAVRMERLHFKAIRKNKEASRLLKNIEKEMRKTKPDMPKVLKLQKKDG